jgi:hypothetical protein
MCTYYAQKRNTVKLRLKIFPPPITNSYHIKIVPPMHPGHCNYDLPEKLMFCHKKHVTGVITTTYETQSDRAGNQLFPACLASEKHIENRPEIAGKFNWKIWLEVPDSGNKIVIVALYDILEMYSITEVALPAIYDDLICHGGPINMEKANHNILGGGEHFVLLLHLQEQYGRYF